ncbi:hypothetical protein EDD64_13629 [Effusibacillus lacus]|nr:hypothetical protein EDD64_13629 [Effusibacillus lacus]
MPLARHHQMMKIGACGIMDLRLAREVVELWCYEPVS